MSGRGTGMKGKPGMEVKKSMKTYWNDTVLGGNERDVSLDALRILGITMVLFNHNNLYYAFFLRREQCDLLYWLEIVFSMISKCGSPLFFMVSGALLLKKDEKYSYTLRHRVLRMVIVMLACSFIASSYKADFNVFLDHLFSGLNWYFYAYLAFLLMLPFIRIFVKGLDSRSGRNFCCMVFLVQTVILLLIYSEKDYTLFNSTLLLSTWWASGNWLFIFPILGCLLHERIAASEKKDFLVVAGAAVFTLAVCTVIMHFDIRFHDGNNLENLRQHAAFALSAFIMLAVRPLEKVRGKTAFVIHQAAGTVFGIFILDVNTVLPDRIADLVRSAVGGHVGFITQEWLIIPAQLIIMGTIIWILRLIPPIRKLI